MMNETEKQFCRANRVECASVAPITMVALGFAEREAALEGTVPIDNKFDAMRHVFWSAALTRALGANRALAWTEVHEQEEPPGSEETCMDRWNNNAGRAIAVNHPEYYSDLHLQNAARTAANTPGVTKNAPYAC
jgi:hypothetical protein